MKMGIKEFREKVSDVAEGDVPILVTNHGRIVGRFIPARATTPSVDMQKWLDARRRFRTNWQAANPDWMDQLLDLDLDGHGEPMEDSPRWPEPDGE